MKIIELGKYKLIGFCGFRVGSTAILQLSVGDIITVEQIDKENKKIFSPEIGEWCKNDLPVKQIKDV